MLFVQGDAIVFMAEIEQELHDGRVSEGAGEMQRCIREAEGSRIRIVQELRVGMEDSVHEERVIVVDCPAKAEGRVDPARALINEQMRIEIMVWGFRTSY